MRVSKIELRYRWRLIQIKLNLWQRLTRLWIAGKLVRLGFWISRDLERGILERARR